MTNQAEDKHVFAESGETIFTRIVKGVHSAKLYGKDVTLTRPKYDEWHCIDDETKEILGEGKTRSEAMREAFYVEAERQGYDQQEASRLRWVLEEQKYRSYGGHKPRRRTKNIDIEELMPKPAPEKVVSIHKKKNEQSEMERVESLLKSYKTAHNETLGGWLYYRRNEKGEMEGSVEGPFETEHQMMMAIMGEVCKSVR